MRVIWVVQRRAFAQERLVHPVGDAVGRGEKAKPVRVSEQPIRRHRPSDCAYRFDDQPLSTPHLDTLCE
jgi:hypothetical protein